MANGRFAFAAADDGQQFGLSVPIDGIVKAKALLAEKRIETVSIRRDTGDLSLMFEGGTVLEAISDSAGYEAWQYGNDSLEVIAQGGGQISMASKN